MKGLQILMIGLLFLISCSSVKKTHVYYLEHPPHTLRILTYNVESNEDPTSHLKYPETTVNAVQTINADVVLLQETTVFWQRQFAQLKHQYPYQGFKHSPLSGVAVLSKYPFKTIALLEPPIGWFPKWIIQVATPEGPVQIANVHLNPPLMYNTSSMGPFAYALVTTQPIRKQEMIEVYEMLNQNLPFIICGDFNEARGGLAVEFLRNNGVADATLAKTQAFKSWHWNVGPFSIDGQYDRIFYSELTLEKFEVVPMGDSDHYPAYADFHR